MSIWEDTAGSGGSESNEKLLIDPYATSEHSTPTFTEPRDVYTANAGYNSPLKQPANAYDSNNERTAFPALRMDEIPSDIQLMIRQCRSSSFYTGASVSALAGIAAIALKTTGRLKVCSRFRSRPMCIV
jgi:hypothetical protein